MITLTVMLLAALGLWWREIIRGNRLVEQLDQVHVENLALKSQLEVASLARALKDTGESAKKAAKKLEDEA